MTDAQINSKATNNGNQRNKNNRDDSDQADLNMRIIQSIIWFIEDNYSSEILNTISFEAGISTDKLLACQGWISLEQVQSIIAQVRTIVGTDQAFMEACIYRMKESYGPLRFLLWASSPGQMLEMGQGHFSSISTFSTGSFSKTINNKYRLKYKSTKKESRLLCLSRQAQSAALPTLWDLPKADLKEISCICHGDDCCEYELSVYEKSRFIPVLTGGILGLGVSWGITLLKLESMLFSSLIWGIIPILGAVAGYILELRRLNRHNLLVAADINKSLSQIVVENQEVHHEILDLHQRQKNWNRRLENQVAERTSAGELLTKRLHSILAEQKSTIQGVSHDMKNPLTVILQTSEIIQNQLSAENRWMAEEQIIAVGRMRLLLDDVLRLETDNQMKMPFISESIDTAQLEESLRRRLRALASDLDLRLSVLSTRETPSHIMIDRVLLDRVMDNLLTNAVKYTEQGSIILELDGKPGFLTVKLSDTGRGITEKNMKLIFHARGSDPEERKLNSHGIGLSVVIRLLDRIGGKLELMSFPNRGSTFWVHFPIKPVVSAKQDNSPEISFTDPISRVVTIRRVV